jgi:hypothetical protein
MPVVAKIDLLPKKVRAEFDRKLIEQGFGGHRSLSDWLKEQGHSISHETIGNYAKKLKTRINDVKLSHDFATAYGYELPDDDGIVTKMLTGLTQDILYRLLIQLHKLSLDLDKDTDLGLVWTILKPLDLITKSLSSVSRSDVAALTIAKHAADVRAKQEAALDKLKNEGKKRGIDDEFLNKIEGYFGLMGDDDDDSTQIS